MKNDKKKRAMPAWEILLIVLGSPLWLPILIAAFAVILAVYISLWAGIVTLWAVLGAFAVSAVGAAFAGVVLTIVGKALPGVFLIGIGFIFAGMSVFVFLVSKLATKGILFVTKKLALSLIKPFRKKDGVQ